METGKPTEQLIKKPVEQLIENPLKKEPTPEKKPDPEKKPSVETIPEKPTKPVHKPAPAPAKAKSCVIYCLVFFVRLFTVDTQYSVICISDFLVN